MFGLGGDVRGGGGSGGGGLMLSTSSPPRVHDVYAILPIEVQIGKIADVGGVGVDAMVLEMAIATQNQLPNGLERLRTKRRCLRSQYSR